MPTRLFTIPLSHPGQAAAGMLRQAGIPFATVSIPSGMHPPVLLAAGFRGVTVPALRWEDGSRVQGSRAIAAAVHGRAPGAGLFPSDPEARARVDAAERWGEEVVQPIPRRRLRRELRESADRRVWFARTATPFPAPALVARLLAPAVIPFVAQAGASRERVDRDAAGLPEVLDRVDALLAEGTIGGPVLNAADWQIGTSVRVLLAFEDLAPLVAGRPAERHALRVQPDAERIPALG